MYSENQNDLLFFDTSGFSMWPFLRAKDKLIIRKTPFDELKCGDIILYNANGRHICHRLIKKMWNGRKYLLYTRGDNTKGKAECVPFEWCLGKVLAVVKNGHIINYDGRVSRFINRIIVFIAPFVAKLNNIRHRILRVVKKFV